jgi:hypothetical protein
MAKRRPLVVVAGSPQELPAGDVLPFDLVTYSLAIGADVAAIDLSADNDASEELTGDTAVVISNWPIGSTTAKLFLQHGVGGPYAVTAWPVTHWIGGEPDFSASAVGDIEIVTITSPDSGSTRIGAHVGTAKAV